MTNSIDETPTPAQDHFLVVGVGASAGGIEALSAFFAHVLPDSGMAYVVILHLSPDYDSQLAAILQAETALPVTKVLERTHVAPNNIYVVPPNQHLLMIDGTIAVSPNLTIEERRAPVDIFFRTLAETHGGRAICVVLSGTGANGSMGLRRVKERGGAAFVQNPREASFNEMPRHAIATDLVDDILPVAEIPAHIVAYASKLGTTIIPVEPQQRHEDQQQALREVFTMLRLRTGHDFSNYKRATILRRIERRMTIRNRPDLPAYAALLREKPEETQALLKDLLISVTNFFRDQQAFEALEQDILPRLVHDKSAESQLRIWVIGCATGEEAYSVAMLCAERTMGVLDAPTVQIFATDIDEAAIAHARQGIYTLNDAADVSPERLRRFFTREGDSYRVRREIREMILFANHNVIKDPPFSHLDLVTCRNMLIYLNQTAQERVLETIHFALNPSGYLFLGSAESADNAHNLFATVNREQHMFQSRPTGIRSYPVPEVESVLRLSEQVRVTPPTIEQEQRALERITYSDLHQQLLEEYAPPSIVVNETYTIVHLSEHAGRYLQITGGEPSNNLLRLIRPELQPDLRAALHQAAERQTNVEAKQITLRVDDRTETINILIRPVTRANHPARGFFLIIFEPSTEDADSSEAVIRADEPMLRYMEEDLRRVRGQLRVASQQYELQAEELKAANEELQALNEELRSAVEELETSKEELQSVNEELRTLNQELKIKIEETTLTSNNLYNLINSTNIGTIFLDRSLRVVLFTPAARDMFNLLPADIGRPLSDITNRLNHVNVFAEAEAVLDTLRSVEREVTTIDNRVFLMRVLPYRTADDHINGVVITFLDITDRVHAEAALRVSSERLRIAIEAAEMGTWNWHVPTGVMYWNEQFFLLLGMQPSEAPQTADVFFARVHPDDQADVRAQLDRAVNEKSIFDAEFRTVQDDGATRWMSGYGQAVEVADNAVVRMSGVVLDITERKRVEADLQRMNEDLEQRVQDRTSALEALNTDLQQEIVERTAIEAERAELLQRIVTAQEDERQRIARELHDSLGQVLTGLNLRLASTQALPQLPPEVHANLTQVRSIAAQIDQEIDRLTMELRPHALNDMTLVEALTSYVQEWSTTSGIPVDLVPISHNMVKLPQLVETTVYRIVQEALSNVLKHAQASQVSLVLEQRNDVLRVVIEDNGKGFERSQAVQNRRSGQQVGLLSMEERALLAGGTLTIESTPGTGTTIYVDIPLSSDGR